MKGFRTTDEDIKINEIAIERKKQFETEFNRYYATQRYEEAFAVCLRYICKAEDKTEIVEKANIVIPKLKNRIQIPSSIPISYDWLIDQLVLAGYNNMKFDGTIIKWKSSTIKLSKNDNTTRITTKCRINIFFRVVIFIALTFITGFIIPLVSNFIGPEISPYNRYYEYLDSRWYDFMLFWGITIAIIFFIIWISVYVKILKQHKNLLRRIARITIDNISK